MDTLRFVTGTQGTPLGLDVTTPNVARMYDYYLGGKDNFEADRTAAERVLALVPGLRRAAVENRRFLRRVVRFLAAEAGISFFDGFELLEPGLVPKHRWRPVAGQGAADTPNIQWGAVGRKP
jgi:hypothetical protein